MIGTEGEQLGVMTLSAAISLAKTKGLDVVEISSAVVPPVCKIINFGKFRYEQEKKEKLAKKNQKIVLSVVVFLG